ncbi:type II secretion system protein [Legionella londiniensis]|nr:type II secretion system protein GspG [Legionella londiniensis]
MKNKKSSSADIASRTNNSKLMLIAKQCRDKGFTLLEILLVSALIAVLLVVTVQTYDTSRQRANVEQAISDIKDIEIAIENYYLENGYKYPPNLAAIGMDGRLDPWGKPYNYLNIAELPEKGNDPQARKDKNLFPLNSDYDLYSMGADGKTKISLSEEASKDDVIRANNGSYIGLGSDY